MVINGRTKSFFVNSYLAKSLSSFAKLKKMLNIVKTVGGMFEPRTAPGLKDHYVTFLEMLNSNDRRNFASSNESLSSKSGGRCEVCSVWQFFSITEAKSHVSILHPKYKKSSLPAMTEFTCKFKGCNMIFSSHQSLRNHVAEKDHHVRSRPNINKKIVKVRQAKKRQKETTTSIADFFNKASAAESAEEAQSPNDQEGKLEFKWCTEEWDGEDGN